MQRVARLEAERVTRAEPARGDAPLEDRVPQARRLVGSAAELAATLARVPGAGDEAADAEHVLLAEREGLDVDSEPVEGLRALDGEERPLRRDVMRLGEQSVIGLDVRRVHDQEVGVGTAPVGDQVVADPTLVVREQGVLGATGLDPVQVVREARLEVLVRPVPVELELSHVGDVEHARRGADGAMLVADRRVLNRHFPSGERHEARAESGVALVQRRAPERLHRRGS